MDTFKDGLEIKDDRIFLTATAVVDIIQNFDKDGYLVPINNIKKIKKKKIDVNYDFRIDTTDPDVDKGSATLRKYHRLLWSKYLPNGDYLHLSDLVKDTYLLYFKNNFEKYVLTSDSIIHTYTKWKKLENIVRNIDINEINDFLKLGYTVGGYIIFPGYKVNNLPTINQERGTNIKICDRFDITLECIRQYYNNETNPLTSTFERYSNFFKLFVNFKGYCEFFFLQDLTLNNISKVKFFLPFDKFENNPIPKTVEEYKYYKDNVMEFCRNRNKRIDNYIYKNLLEECWDFV